MSTVKLIIALAIGLVLGSALGYAMGLDRQPLPPFTRSSGNTLTTTQLGALIPGLRAGIQRTAVDADLIAKIDDAVTCFDEIKQLNGQIRDLHRMTIAASDLFQKCEQGALRLACPK